MTNEKLESLFESWLIEHKGVVLKVARAYTLTAEDCQDLAQEILLQVWRSMPQFQGRASASTWFTAWRHTALGWRARNAAASTPQPILALEELSIAGLDSAQQLAEREAVERLMS